MSLDKEGNTPRSSQIRSKSDGPLYNGERANSSIVRTLEPNAQRRRKPHVNNNHTSSSTSIKNRTLSDGTFSAIDLGTNNCRLLIAKPTSNGFRVVDAFSRIVRLGEGMAQTGRLSEAAMDRTIDALKVCASKIKRRNVSSMRHVATHACRIADNSEEFIERVFRETGLELDVISSAEEAKLAVMGCQSLIAYHNRHAIIFDIGGGSTELIWVKSLGGGRTEILGWTSIPWGVVNLAETFSYPGDSVSESAYQKMLDSVHEHLMPFEEKYQISRECKYKKTQFLGTSGTVTTLASLHLKLPEYDRNKVDGLWMKSLDAKNLSRDVANLSFDERCALPSIGSDRADLVVAGCAILEAMLSTWNVKNLRVADRGIREGILRGLMKKDSVPKTASGASLEQN